MIIAYSITMVFLIGVWLVSWEFLRQENERLRVNNRKLRDSVTYLYEELDRYRPVRSEAGKIVRMGKR